MQHDLGRVSVLSPTEGDPSEAPYSWDVTTDRASQGESVSNDLPRWQASPEGLKRMFKEFISSYRASSRNAIVLDYMKQLQSNLYSGRNFLEINWEDAICFSQDLGIALRDRATQCIFLFEEALREIAEAEHYFPVSPTPTPSHDIQLQILWASPLTPLRDLSHVPVAHLLCVPGLVIKVGKTRLRCVRALLQCQSCKTVVALPLSNDLELPRRCVSNVSPLPGTPPCRPAPYTLLAQSCAYEDAQRVRLQELPQGVPPGEMPRCVEVLVDRGLTDRVAPGDRVGVVAVNAVMERGGGGGGGGGGKGNHGSRNGVGLRTAYLKGVGWMGLSQEGGGGGGGEGGRDFVVESGFVVVVVVVVFVG